MSVDLGDPDAKGRLRALFGALMQGALADIDDPQARWLAEVVAGLTGKARGWRYVVLHAVDEKLGTYLPRSTRLIVPLGGRAARVTVRLVGAKREVACRSGAAILVNGCVVDAMTSVGAAAYLCFLDGGM